MHIPGNPIWLLGLVQVCCLGVFAEKPGEEWLESVSHRASRSSYGLLYSFLSLPNDAQFPDQVERNFEWVRTSFQSRGFHSTVLETDGAPLLLMEKKSGQSLPTVLVYLQVDGQPVDPDRWDQVHPFQPVLKESTGEGWKEIPWDRLNGQVDPEWRIFARSASDAKGPIVMWMAALDALEEHGIQPAFNIKLILDFEEEMGSPHLPEAVERHRDLFLADMMLILDGPRHLTNLPTLTFGARGIATITLTVFGPRVPQHSGHYGNYAPNPASRLARILASMKDSEGRVTIPGYYDGIALDRETRALLAQTPDDEEGIRRALGIAQSDALGSYQESIQYPSLNIRGLASGWVGDQARTIIPDSATAEIDVRLVPETNPERLIDLIRRHVEGQGYYLIPDREPSEEERMQHSAIASIASEVSYGAFRTPYESPVGLWLTAALTRAFGRIPIRIRMAGGSIPIAPFVNSLGLPAVSVPTVNPDNNQHSPNENLRVGNFVEGVKTFLAILTEEH